MNENYKYLIFFFVNSNIVYIFENIYRHIIV